MGISIYQELENWRIYKLHILNMDKKILSQCKYFKGEDACPFGGTIEDYISYSSLVNNPPSFWWFAEKEVIEHGFDNVETGIKCKIFKHMDFSPLTEHDALLSYLSLLDS